MSVLESRAQSLSTPSTADSEPAAKSVSSVSPSESLPAHTHVQSDAVRDYGRSQHDSSKDHFVALSTSTSSLSSTADVRHPYNCRDFSIARLLDFQPPSSTSRTSLPLDLRCYSDSGSRRKLEEEQTESDATRRCLDQQVWRGGRLDAELGHQSSFQRHCHPRHVKLVMLDERADDVVQSLCTFTVDEQRQMTYRQPHHHSETQHAQGLYSIIHVRFKKL